MHNRLGVRLVLWASLACAGCGGTDDDLPREPVWGTVTFEGKPLRAGMIQFYPDPPPGSTQAGAPIRDGSYSVPRQGGPIPGPYKVVITEEADGPAPPAGPPGEELPIPKQAIPGRYNTKSTLTAEVKKGGDNRFDFDLKK